MIVIYGDGRRFEHGRGGVKEYDVAKTTTTKAADNWHESYREKPFSLAVSNRIRYLTWKRADLIKERKAKFNRRDHLLVELYKAGDDKAKAATLKAEHSDVVREIEDLATSIKWHDDEFENVVDNADAAKLYDEVAIPVPPKELFAPKDKPEPKAEKNGEPKGDPAKDDDKETGQLHEAAGGKPLPVGVPDEPAPATKPAKAPLEDKGPVNSQGKPKRRKPAAAS